MNNKPLITPAFAILLGVSLLSTAHADITNGLQGYWTFDAGSGPTATDVTGNNNLGTLTNFADTGYTTMWTNGWFTNALIFNQNGETTNYVSVANSTTMNAPTTAKAWTLAAWVKLSGAQVANAGIVAKGLNGAEAYGLYVNGSGQFTGVQHNSANSGGQTTSSTFAAALNTWYHVALTFVTGSGGSHVQMIMYINGTNNNNGPLNSYTTVYSTNLPVTIGARFGNNLNSLFPFKGTIDEVRIYNRALTASDVFQLYTNNAPGTAHGLAIATQPRNVTCYSNDTAVFAVGLAATNSYVPPFYQWQLNGANIAGATSNPLTLPNANATNAGSYTVVVSNYSGLSVTSSPAVLTVNPLPAADTTTSLVGWWKMDDSSGSATAADSSGNGNSGELTNFTDTTYTSQWVSGIVGGALFFNGDGNGTNLVAVPSLGTSAPAVLDFNASPVFTLAAWVQASSTQTNEAAIIAKGTGGGGEQYVLELNGGNYRFFVRDTNAVTVNITSSTPFNGAWQHVAGVVNATNGMMSLYVNGTVVGSAVAPFSILATNHEVSIGNRQSGTTKYSDPFTGAIDDVRIYGRDLTSADIFALYAVGGYPAIGAQFPAVYTNLYTLYSNASPVFRLTGVTGVTPLSYHWYTNGVVDPTGTSASYQLQNLQPGGMTNYCVVANSLGSVTSFVWTATVVAAPTAPYAQSVLNLNPAGYWRLDEADDQLGDGNAGVIAHDYLAGNNGIYTNTTLGQQGYGQGLASKYGYNPPTDPVTSALFTGGNNSYAGLIKGGPNFNAPNGATTNFTVECWVNGSGAQPSAAAIVSKGVYLLNDAWNLSVDVTSQRNFRFIARTANGTLLLCTSGKAADTATWHHLAGVFDETHGLMTLYIDGVSRATTALGTTAGAYDASANIMSIGSAQNNTKTGPYSLTWNGYVNDVAVYNSALTAAQVQAHYLAAGFPPSMTQTPVTSTNVDEGTTLIIPAAGGGGTPPVVTQWYDLTTGLPIANQTNATLVISNILAADYNNHTLSLSISNAYGNPTANVFVTVNSGAPVVTVNPASVTVYSNRPIVFTATATGTEPFSYQWSTNGTDVPNATNTTFTTIAVMGSSTIQCRAMGPGGSGTNSATLTGIAIPSDSYARGILADGPLAYWRLDEPLNATVANDYVGAHNATYNNVTNGLPGFSPSVPDTAAGFGMNGFTSFSMALEQNNSGVPPIDLSTLGTNAQFSVEAWVKAPAGQITGAGIVTKGYGNGGEQFNLDVSGDAFRFFVRDAGGGTHGPTSAFHLDGTWHHVVGICNMSNGVVNLFVDGVLQATTTNAPGLGLLKGNTVLTSIGARMSSSTDTSYSFQLSDAVLDDVAIYGYALSSNQVAAHFTTAATPPQFVQDLSPQMYGYVGFPLTLSVLVSSGSPITGYQWQRDGTNLIDGGSISGSHSSVLSLGTATSSSGGSTYRVFVTNSAAATPAVSTAGTLSILPRLEFNGFGNEWSSQGSPSSIPKYIGSNLLRLTDGNGSEACSSFFSYPVYVGGFLATFTYQAGGNKAADGTAFVVQNDSRGPAALGSGGGSLGYAGTNSSSGLGGGITNSAAVEFNLYNNRGVGYAFQTNGAAGTYSSASPINLASGDPIDVTLLYADGVLTMTLTDAVAQASFTASTNLDLPSALGTNVAYVGFTAASGSLTAVQTISNFTFVSLPTLGIAPAAGPGVILAWPSPVGGYRLQESPSVLPTAWTNVSTPVTTANGTNSVTVSTPGTASFFRLINKP